LYVDPHGGAIVPPKAEPKRRRVSALLALKKSLGRFDAFREKIIERGPSDQVGGSSAQDSAHCGAGVDGGSGKS